MRSEPDNRVLAWIDSQSVSNLYVTTITVAEILTGIALLPDGRKQHRLIEASEYVFNSLFSGRVYVFDSKAASAYADIFMRRHTSGRPISQSDCQIAAIAKSQKATIATRNITDFEVIDIKLINPWIE